MGRKRWTLLPSSAALLLLAAGLVSFGCGSTREHRARQYSQVFQAMPSENQARALKGEIALGDSRELVYIALGPPQAQRIIAGIEIWEYQATPAEPDWTREQPTGIFTTPTSGAFGAPLDDRPGHLELEFEDGTLTVWDYQAVGYPLTPARGQPIALPRSPP